MVKQEGPRGGLGRLEGSSPPVSGAESSALPLSTVWPAVKVVSLAAATMGQDDLEAPVLRALGIVEVFLERVGVLAGEPSDEDLERVGAMLREAMDQAWPAEG